MGGGNQKKKEKRKKKVRANVRSATLMSRPEAHSTARCGTRKKKKRSWRGEAATPTSFITTRYLIITVIDGKDCHSSSRRSDDDDDDDDGAAPAATRERDNQTCRFSIIGRRPETETEEAAIAGRESERESEREREREASLAP